MNLYEFLNNPALQLPLKRTTLGNDYIAFVETKLIDYSNLLDQLESPASIKTEVDSKKSNIKGFIDASLEVIRLAMAGHPAKAYDQFSAGIAHVRDQLDVQSSTFTERDINVDLVFNVLYRVRKQIALRLSKEQMFHIPFELRHLVATQRYSVPGLPCLYLAGSLFTCWSEMGSPPFHEIQASAFWLKEGVNLKVVNFSNRPKRLLKYLTPLGDLQNPTNNSGLIVAYLVLWPLMALCSVVVKFRDSPYKPEYIMPQILLQWITGSLDYNGICYFSMHVDAVTRNPLETCNLVLPAKELQAEGRSPTLRSFFKMTDPLSWEMLKAIDFQSCVGFSRNMDDFEFAPGIIGPYWTSDFGQIETKLKMIAFEMKKKIGHGETGLGEVGG